MYYVKAKSLKFLSLDELLALGYLKRDNKRPQLTDHYLQEIIQSN